MTEGQIDTTSPPIAEPAADWTPTFARRLKQGTTILTSLAALFAAVFGVGTAISKFADKDSFVQRLFRQAKPTAVTAADSAVSLISKQCHSWQQSVASTFDREYQRHDGHGYTIVLKARFSSITKANDAANALSDEVWGKPIFPVAIEQPTRQYVVGIGFNITREKAEDLLRKMSVCYQQSVQLLDPSVEVRTPRKVVV